jgi:ribosome biogenesis SPOUT family RNA methylase Rps3
MKETGILGVLIKDRIKESGRTQGVLTKYAHLIRSRLGFHEVTTDVCSRTGVMILQLAGNSEQWDLLEKELNEIGGVEVKKMSFEY